MKFITMITAILLLFSCDKNNTYKQINYTGKFKIICTSTNITDPDIVCNEYNVVYYKIANSTTFVPLYVTKQDGSVAPINCDDFIKTYKNRNKINF